jgi:pyruvate,water dikinase
MHFYTLDQIEASDRLQVGDAAFFLSQVMRSGHPVVPGAVVTASVFRHFLETMHWLEPFFSDLPNSMLYLDVNNPLQLQAIARTIRHAIEAAPLPPTDWLATLLSLARDWQVDTLILKPSIAIAKSGYVESIADGLGLIDAQICQPHEASVCDGLRRLWGNLFNAKSLLYWQQVGIPLQQIQLGVLVQPLFTPDLSGELLSIGPQAEIRATLGLSQAIASGEVLPDCYHLDVTTGTITHQIQQKHLYRCVTASSAPSSRYLTSTMVGLYLAPIATEEQQNPPVSANQLQQLSGVAHRIFEILKTPFCLTWSVHNSAAFAHPIVVISDVCPQPWRDRLPSQRDDEVGQTLNSAAASFLPAADRVATTDLDHRSVLDGIGVATGQASGVVWIAQDVSIMLPVLPPACIIVSPMLPSTWLPNLTHVAGIVTEQGGRTSHGAIVARELQVPAVVGVANATRLLRQGDRITIDGDRGRIYRGEVQLESPPLAIATSRPEATLEGKRSVFAPSWTTELPIDPPTHPPTPPAAKDAQPSKRPQLWVSLSRWATVAQLTRLPIDGIGLLRSELAMLDLLEHRHPVAWVRHHNPDIVRSRLIRELQQVAELMAPRPVFYRSLDMRSHEYQTLNGSPEVVAEINPILGIHGTLSYGMNADSLAWFQLELSALRQLQETGQSNIRLLLPFVRTVEEFQSCREQVIAAGLTQDPAFELWIMAEVPSVAWLLHDYAQAGVDGIAIGSNDLTQLVLAVDRDHPELSSRLDAYHPAVMRAIAHIAQTARQLNLSCSICGQLSTPDRALLQQFMDWGVSAVSVEPSVAHEMYTLLNTMTVEG